MRLSEAIMFGSCLIKPRAGGRRNTKQRSGCALDMGMEAMYGGIWKEANRVWPWLNQRADIGQQTWMCRITSRFDLDVMHRKTMTLDQFVDWVRSVEPAETPAPQSEQAVAERSGTEATDVVTQEGI